MLTRRVQLLLDQERFDKVTRAAQEQQISVAAVIRQAIDDAVRDPVEIARRQKIWAELLAAEPIPVPDDPADLRRELDEAHDRADW